MVFEFWGAFCYLGLRAWRLGEAFRFRLVAALLQRGSNRIFKETLNAVSEV